VPDQDQEHDHDHVHHGEHHHPLGAGRAVSDGDKDPAEQEALARDLAGELTDLFARYVSGGIDFAELSFATYDVLQDLHVVATGAYELVADDTSDDPSDDEEDGEDGPAEGNDEEDGGIDDPYDEAAATEEQEDLSGEPAR
jgi:cobalamin biosynthesis protein CobT